MVVSFVRNPLHTRWGSFAKFKRQCQIRVIALWQLTKPFAFNIFMQCDAVIISYPWKISFVSAFLSLDMQWPLYRTYTCYIKARWIWQSIVKIWRPVPSCIKHRSPPFGDIDPKAGAGFHEILIRPFIRHWIFVNMCSIPFALKCSILRFLTCESSHSMPMWS